MKPSLVEEARRELARRELARRELFAFCRYVMPVYPEARHLRLLCAYLELAERYLASGGETGISRLMVNLPPQYWKSTTCSVLFVAWLLGRNPEMRGILGSYNASLATTFSRRTRETVRSEAYRRIFGDLAGREDVVMLAGDSSAVESWDLAGHFGGLTAAGVGGGITGKSAHFIIIDDPHKDRADAESERSREAVWNWYTSAVYTRLQSNSVIIVMQTRWHADDLSGRLLKAMATDALADQWTVLCLPALAEAWPPAATATVEVQDEDPVAALNFSGGNG